MSGESATFVWTSQALERHTPLNRMQARGTIRLALRKCGFEAELVEREQMLFLIQHVLPGELARRGIEEDSSVCDRLAAELRAANLPVDDGRREDPETVFTRILLNDRSAGRG